MESPQVEHVAVKVRNFDEALAFFTDVMGMEVTLTDPADGQAPLSQAWVGGIQLQRDDQGEGPYQGDMTHIGLVADEVELLLQRAYATEGVRQAPGKPRNWFVVPCGVMIELNARA